MEALVDKLSLTVVGIPFLILTWRSLRLLYYNHLDTRSRIDVGVGFFLGVFFLVQVVLFWLEGHTNAAAWRFFDLVVGVYMLARITSIAVNVYARKIPTL